MAADGIEVGKTILSVIPSIQGLSSAINKEMKKSTPGIAKLGKQTGKTFSDGIVSGVKDAAKEMEVYERQMQADANKTASQVAKAREKQADANATVTIAEKKLQEAIAKTGDESARTAAATLALEKAQRTAKTASNDLNKALAIQDASAKESQERLQALKDELLETDAAALTLSQRLKKAFVAKFKTNADDRDLAATDAALDEVAHTRDVKIKPKVDKSALAKVGGVLGSIGAFAGTKTLLGTGALTGITGLGTVAAGASVNVLSLASSILSLAPAALALPGMLAGAAAGVATLMIAIKNAPPAIKALGKQFSGLQKTVAGKFWDQATKPIENLAKTVLPVLNTGLGKVSHSMGGLIGSLANGFSAKLVPNLAPIFNNTAKAVQTLSGAAKPFANILGILGKTGSKYLQPLAGLIVDLVHKFNGFLIAASKSGNLQKWINTGIGGLKSLVKIGTSAVNIVLDIIGAAGKSGGSTLKTFASTMGKIAGLLNTKSVKSGMVQVFTTVLGLAGKIVKGALPLIKTVLGDIAEFIVKDGPSIANFISNVLSVAGTIAKAMQPVVNVVIKQLIPAIMTVAGQLLQMIKQNMPLLKKIFGQIGQFVSVIIQLWKTISPIVMPIVKVLFKFILQTISNALKVATAIVKILVDLFTGNFSDMKTQLLKIWHALWGEIQDIVKSVFGINGGGIVQIAIELVGWFKNNFKKSWAVFQDIFVHPIQAAWNWITQTAVPGIKNAFSGLVTDIGNIFVGIQNAIAKPINWVIDNVFNKFIDGINTIAHAVGAKSFNVPHIPDVKLASKPASNGVGGNGGGSTTGTDKKSGWSAGGWTGPGSKYQPAGVVHADEFVINKKSRKTFEKNNPGVLDRINRTGYADGGAVNPISWANQHVGTSGWFDQCLAMVNEAWGYSVARFKTATAKASEMAGPINTTGIPPAGAAVYWDPNHVALADGKGDVYSTDILQKGILSLVKQSLISSKWGLKYDGWWSPTGAKAGSGAPSKGSILKRLEGIIPGIPKSYGALKNIGSAFMNSQLGNAAGKIATTALKDLSPLGLLASGIGKLAGGSVQKQIQAMLPAYGWGNDQWSPLNQLLTKESSWNPNAVNSSSGAYGLFQLLGPNLAKLGSDKSLQHQAQIGLGYIKSRYLNPAGAWAHEKAFNWYAKGTKSAKSGLAVVGEAGPELINFNGGEAVTNSKQLTAAVSAFMQANRQQAKDNAIAQYANQLAGLQKQLTKFQKPNEQFLADQKKLAAAQKILANPKHHSKKTLKEAASDVASYQKALNGLSPSQKQYVKLQNKVNLATQELSTAKGIDVKAGLPHAVGVFVKQFDKQLKKVSSLTKRVNTISTNLKSANSSLTSDKAARTSYISGVQSQYATAAQLPTDQTSAASMVASMQATLATAKQFLPNLKMLKAEGLNNTMLDQIIQMGPQDGSSIAAALVQGGHGPLSQLNSLMGQINAVGTQTANWAAKALGYDSAISNDNSRISRLTAAQKVYKKRQSNAEVSLTESAKHILHNNIVHASKLAKTAQKAAEPKNYFDVNVKIDGKDLDAEITKVAQSAINKNAKKQAGKR